MLQSPQHTPALRRSSQLQSTRSSLLANQTTHCHFDDRTQKQSCVFVQYVDASHAVLEYNCGDGSLLETIDCSSKAGIEPVAMIAAIASRKGLDVRACANEFVGKTFDRILIGGEIEKLQDAVPELVDLRSLLADTGLLVISQLISVNEPSVGPAMDELSDTLDVAGFCTDTICVKRHSYRSSGIQFRNDKTTPPESRKTYWVVKPFLSLVAVAHKTA